MADLLTHDDQAVLAALSQDLNHDLVDSTRILTAIYTGATPSDLSTLTYSAMATLTTGSNPKVAIRVPQYLVRDPALTGGRMVYTPSGYESETFRDFVSHSGDATHAYFVGIGELSSTGNTTYTAHWEESDLDLNIHRKHLAAEVSERLVSATQESLLNHLLMDNVSKSAASDLVTIAIAPFGAVPQDVAGLTYAKTKSTLTNPVRDQVLILRVPIANIAKLSITSGFVRASDNPFYDYPFADFAEHSRNSTHVFLVGDTAFGGAINVTFWEVDLELALPIKHLADAVVARLLPAVIGDAGQILQVNSGKTAPEWAAAPAGGGGGGAPTMVGAVALSTRNGNFVNVADATRDAFIPLLSTRRQFAIVRSDGQAFRYFRGGDSPSTLWFTGSVGRIPMSIVIVGVSADAQMRARVDWANGGSSPGTSLNLWAL